MGLREGKFRNNKIKGVKMEKTNEISRLMNQVFSLSSQLYFFSTEIAEDLLEADTPLPPSIQETWKSKLKDSLNSILFLFSFLTNLEGADDGQTDEKNSEETE